MRINLHPVEMIPDVESWAKAKAAERSLAHLEWWFRDVSRQHASMVRRGEPMRLVVQGTVVDYDKLNAGLSRAIQISAVGGAL